MKRSTMRTMLMAAGFVLAAASPAFSQSDYPNRPVRLIIPFPPGGSNDVVGRMIGDQLSKQLGKQVVIDNRAGAGGVIGTELAAKEKPVLYKNEETGASASIIGRLEQQLQRHVETQVRSDTGC